jgi:hypothetical protein
MLLNRTIVAALLLLMNAAASRAATSIISLAQAASVVMIGSLTGIQDGPTPGQFKLSMSVTRVLKGEIGTSALVVSLLPGDAYVLPAVIPQSLLGQTGIWFLSGTGDGYQLLPTQAGRFLPEELQLPLGAPLAAAQLSGTLEQQLLQYLVGWYHSLPSPTVRDDMKCLAGLQSPPSDVQNSLAAASSLMGSLTVSDQVIGITGAITLSSDNAVSALSSVLNAVGSSPKFYLVTDALAISYQPHGVASIAALKKIIDRHSTAPGIDAAAGAALSKIVNKQTLPVMAELLNSSDSTAQLRAASFFGLFTLFADSTGSVAGGGPIGPYATDETRRYMPSSGSGITPQQYSQFWLQWWGQNHGLFGF